MVSQPGEPRRILCAEFDGAIAEDARETGGEVGVECVIAADDRDRFLVFADRQNGANCTVASLGVGKLATNQGNQPLSAGWCSRRCNRVRLAKLSSGWKRLTVTRGVPRPDGGPI